MTGSGLTDALIWIPFCIIFAVLAVVILTEGRKKKR